MKRFTETCKWSKEWYQELCPTNKCLWQYLCDNCDSAGVWETNWKLASFQIGAPVQADNLASFGTRISCLSDGKILIVSFVDFQYGTLSKDCPAHKPVFKTIQKHSLKYPTNTLTLGYSKAINSLQEKEMDKEEVQEKESVGKGTGEGIQPVNRSDTSVDWRKAHSNARVVLFFLNEVTGAKFTESHKNLDLIAARLVEVEFDVAGVKVMIQRQTKIWKPEGKSDFLTPFTLFSDDKFPKYYGMRDMPATPMTNGKPRSLSGHEADHSPGVAWPGMKEFGDP